MKRTGAAPQLRGFAWPLAGLQRKMDVDLENARLALHEVQREARREEEAAHRRQAQQREQEDAARQCLQRDLRLGADAVRYLAGLQAARMAADARRGAVDQQLALQRAACAQRQRQLEAVQSLRDAAQDLHAQGDRRRACRDADAAWLALVQQRHAQALRTGGGS